MDFISKTEDLVNKPFKIIEIAKIFDSFGVCINVSIIIINDLNMLKLFK